MKKGKKIFIIIVSVIVLIAGICAFELYISVNWLRVNHFELESEKIDQPVRAVIQ